MGSLGLPTLDASALRGSSHKRADFARSLLEGLSDQGLVKLVDHGIPDQEVEEVFDACRKFFRLPPDVRQRLANDPKRGQQRGWSHEGEEKTWWLESNRGEEAPDFGDNKESFDHGPPSDSDFPNKWPTESEQPGFQPLMEAFFDHGGALILALLESLAIALNVPADTFTSRCTNAASTIRVNHFPPAPEARLDNGKTSRIWPHYDFGIVSFVFPDKVGGLEYEDRANPGIFIPLDYVRRGELLFLVSETMQRWTNDRLKACLHRVTKPKQAEIADGTVPERTSIVYFCKADRHVDVGPLESFVTNDHPARYPQMTALEYQAIRNAAHYPS